LAARAPVGDPVGVALSAGDDRPAAPRARPADPPVHPVCVPPTLEGAARLAERPPRRELDCPERLRAPLVADARDQALVEERVSERTTPLAGAELRDHAGELGRIGEDVGAELSD